MRVLTSPYSDAKIVSIDSMQRDDFPVSWACTAFRYHLADFHPSRLLPRNYISKILTEDQTFSIAIQKPPFNGEVVAIVAAEKFNRVTEQAVDLIDVRHQPLLRCCNHGCDALSPAALLAH